MGYYDTGDCLSVTVGGSLISILLIIVSTKIRQKCCKRNGVMNSCGFLFTATFYVVLIAGFFTTWYLVHKQLYWPEINHAWSLGMVDHNSAKVWVRSVGEKTIKVNYAPVGAEKWLSSDSFKLDPKNNWTTTVRLKGLQPATRYEYQVISESKTLLSGEFNGAFTTYPLPGESKQHVKFNFGSCLMPLPWTNMQIFDFWGKQELDFALLIGDAVYLDTFGVILPEQAYPQVLADPVYSKFFQNTPNYFMYDDHELINDYDEGPHSYLFNSTMGYWNHYYGAKNPSTSLDALYFNVTYGDVGFFLMDTRMYRSPKIQKDDKEKTMLGKKQLEALKQFLLDPKLTFKFLVSPVPFTVRLDLIDGWQGYITEREEILDFIENNNISGCAILSADSHFSGAYELRPWLYEYSASPLQSIPLVQSVYFHPEDHPVLHPLDGYVIPDHQIFSSDITTGASFSYGHVEVNTQSPTPWYRVSIYSFNAFGHLGASPHFKSKVYLANTKPSKWGFDSANAVDMAHVTLPAAKKIQPATSNAHNLASPPTDTKPLDDQASNDDDTQTTSILGFDREDPFKAAGEDASDVVHLRLLSRGRKKATIIQGLPEKLNLKKFLSALNNEFHCSGGIAVDPTYGQIIKLTGDQREGVRTFLLKNNIAAAASIKIHGV